MSEPSIGIMEGAFFVSKGEILSWVNTFLQLNLEKIEQLGTGAVHCALMYSLFPHSVNMQKIGWKAKNEWEFINNYKILQSAFSKCKLNKYIEIEKLSKAKYQDNLEFAQWMKRFFDLNQSKVAAEYCPLKARDNCEVDFSMFVKNKRVNKQFLKERDVSSKPKQQQNNRPQSKYAQNQQSLDNKQKVNHSYLAKPKLSKKQNSQQKMDISLELQQKKEQQIQMQQNSTLQQENLELKLKLKQIKKILGIQDLEIPEQIKEEIQIGEIENDCEKCREHKTHLNEIAQLLENIDCFGISKKERIQTDI